MHHSQFIQLVTGEFLIFKQVCFISKLTHADIGVDITNQIIVTDI